MHKWGLAPLTNCRYGAEEQTADHILAFCPLYHPPNGTLGLAFKQQNCASDNKIGSNEEEDKLKTDGLLN